jgi:ferric-dicitrate binding protein FerR (iron transport regulator)
MSDEYLWDRSGEPDPEIQRLEDALRPLRAPQPPPEWRPQPNVRAMPARSLWDARSRGAMAAGIALVLGASWLVSRPVSMGWKVASVEGVPLAGSSPVRTTGRLAEGQALVTDSGSRARLDVGEIGEVELEPNSRLRLVRAHRSDHRLALDRGTLRAMIWAPPRLFSVETPAAVAVDFGCAYTLKVEDSDTTTLHVTMGWVGFEQNGHESWVPAGAECITRAGKRPGTPYFVDASDAFRAALARLDFEHDQAALDEVLSSARRRDALTLWHLLPKTTGAAQERVYDRMAELAPPPAGVTREGVLNGDRHMLDRWWDVLGYGDSSFWRIWKGLSPFATK